MIRSLHSLQQGTRKVAQLANCLLAAALVFGFLACSGGGGGGGGGTTGGGTGAEQIDFSGTAMLLDDDTVGFSSSAEAQSGITVTVSSDIDANGSIDTTEQASDTTDSDGSFSITAPVAVGTRAVVSFEVEGYATQLKAVDINSLSAVTGVDATLSKLRTLSESGGGWRDSNNTVSVSNIDIASGAARAFNPATEIDRFPGEFADDQGNMLISGVFAAFDLRDGNGRAVRAVSESNPATVRMKIPRDTWGVLKDVELSTADVIDVPMYYFDEETGEWVQDGTGHLEDGEGNTITAAQLATITADTPTFSGSVYAVSEEVTHFSYWNVDYPVDTHACVSGTITDEQGAAVAGASVSISGISYTGTSSTVVTDANGSFCVDVMRNEASGEDLDGDGVTGETQTLSLTVRSGSTLYRLTEFQLTSGQGSCPDGCMTQDFQLTTANEVEIACCNATGGVYDSDGTAVAGAAIFAFDDAMNGDLLGTLCTEPFSFLTTSEADGSYSVSSELERGLKIYASHTETVGDYTYYHIGQRNLTTCPSGDVDISTELLYCVSSTPLIVSVSGQQIDWTPAVSVNYLYVTDNLDTGLKWMVYSDTGFTPPVTFGTLPSGATEQTAASGSLAVTDSVFVSSIFADTGGGTHCNNSGTYLGFGN
jgi:hypothetical protein